MTPQEQLLERVKADFVATGKVVTANCAFGDVEGCHGILEMVVPLPDGGIGTKFYGCSYILKGFPQKDVVEGLGLAKSLISALPRELVFKSFWIKAGVFLTFILNRKWALHLARVVFSTIYSNEVKKCGIPPEKYSKPVKEMRRVVYKILDEELISRKITLDPTYPLLHEDTRTQHPWEDLELVATVTEFLSLFIELDSAYRFRLQDVLGGMDKNALEKDPLKEINRLLALWVEREDSFHGLRFKILPLKKMVMTFLRLSSYARGFAKRFLQDLDLDKIKLDEDDWYFCLRRNNYHFGGLTMDERMKIKDEIDQRKGHIFLDVSMENGGIKISIPK